MNEVELDKLEEPSFLLEDTFNYNLSEYDVALHDQITGNPVNAPKHILNKVLWEMGMDTKGHMFKTFKQQHRTLQGKSKKGIMFAGKERSDKAYLKSGMATLAGHIESVWDEGLKQELRQISR